MSNYEKLIQHILGAKREADRLDIKTNAIVINENYASVDFIKACSDLSGNIHTQKISGILGMNIHFTKDALPDNVSYMIFKKPEQPKQKKLCDYTKQELLEELLRREEKYK